ncbi:hypothetical protein EYR38_009715 [Pleurotus pulmonarius]|nr:hypothetical protein EYR38_010390 [Pleurotus pulmonarius]KAF4590415.1 hypothetical protein EYR38_009715 [Pleurotus pulmonarius]
MGPGRPRLYKTPEEKAMANRAKSKRSYDKHKRAIGVRRTVRQRKQTVRERKHAIPGAVRQGPPRGLDPIDVPGWLDLSATVAAKFRALANGSTREYAEHMYQRYALIERKEFLNDAMLELEKLQAISRRCEAAVLQLAGVGDEFKEVERVGKEIYEANAFLEDLMCYVLGGYSDAIDAYQTRSLQFQQA